VRKLLRCGYEWAAVLAGVGMFLMIVLALLADTAWECREFWLHWRH